MTSLVKRERLLELLDRARGRRIAVIGDVMLDAYLTGEVERISPEAPVPVVRVRDQTHALGGAANVAQNVVAVGANCDLVGVVGADRGGATLRNMLADISSGDALIEAARCTTLKTRIMARGQQLVRFDEEVDDDLTGAELERLLDSARSVLETADAVILQDYNKGVLVPRVIEVAMDVARTRRIPVIVDPKYRNFFLYSGATVFKPNRRELESALGAAVDLDHPEALPGATGRLNVRNLLLTLGERGMVLLTEAGEILRIATQARQVYDVVGAGDTVSAYLATMLAAQASPTEAAFIANIAAGIEVGKMGAATVSTPEVLDEFDQYIGFGQ